MVTDASTRVAHMTAKLEAEIAEAGSVLLSHRIFAARPDVPDEGRALSARWFVDLGTRLDYHEFLPLSSDPDGGIWIRDTMVWLDDCDVERLAEYVAIKRGKKEGVIA